MTKYKAGDEVTVRLDEEDAPLLNNDGLAGFYASQIISHTPKRDLLDEMEAEMDRSNTPSVYGVLNLIIRHLREKEAERG